MKPLRLLLVISNDYGELSTALSLVEGQGFDAALAVPERLSSAVPDAHVHRCRSLADLLGAMDREGPDAVLLFSGYLLAINQLLDESAVEMLVSEIRRRRLPLATTDPFLGILSDISPDTFTDANPLKAALTGHFRRLSRILRQVPHLYPVAPPPSAGAQGLSFFNPLAFTLPRQSSGQRTWLFVLSAEDYAAQVARLGAAGFTRVLADRLRDALRHGRSPAIVAPEPCLRALGADADLHSASLISYCPPATFRPLLLGAEYAFYWNIVSNSLLPRVMNRLPVFFFDRGHLLHAVPPLFAAAMRHYYRDANIAYLSMVDSLEPDGLGELASRHLQSMAPTVVHISSQPMPREMLSRLIERSSHAP